MTSQLYDFRTCESMDILTPWCCPLKGPEPYSFGNQRNAGHHSLRKLSAGILSEGCWLTNLLIAPDAAGVSLVVTMDIFKNLSMWVIGAYLACIDIIIPAMQEERTFFQGLSYKRIGLNIVQL